jgi:hypothetical protein
LLGLSKEYPKLRETLIRLATAKGKEYIAEMLGKDACLVGKNPLAFSNVTFSSPAVFKGGYIDPLAAIQVLANLHQAAISKMTLW